MEQDLEKRYHYLKSTYYRRLKAIAEKMIEQAEDKKYAANYISYKAEKVIERLYTKKHFHGLGMIELMDTFDHYQKMGFSFNVTVKKLYLFMKGMLNYDPDDGLFFFNSGMSMDVSLEQKFGPYENLEPIDLIWQIGKTKAEMEFNDFMIKKTGHHPNAVKDEVIDGVDLKDVPKIPDQLLKSREITISQQLMAVYYLLRSHNIMPSKEDGNVLSYSRLALFLIGKGDKKASNTEQYRHLLHEDYPHIKSKQRLKEDLHLILKYFEEANVQPVVALIKKELESLFKF